jgi:hypothetical protein
MAPAGLPIAVGRVAAGIVPVREGGDSTLFVPAGKQKEHGANRIGIAHEINWLYVGRQAAPSYLCDRGEWA